MKNLITILCLCLFSGCSVYTEEETLLNKIHMSNNDSVQEWYEKYLFPKMDHTNLSVKQWEEIYDNGGYVVRAPGLVVY